MKLKIWIASCLLFVIGIPVYAQETAASVVLSIGKNYAQQPEQEARLLKRKSAVFSNDQISTGPKGQLQLRFTDGSRLSLRPETLFHIENFQFDGDKPRDGSSVYRLLKGGLRTITGTISSAQPDNYRVNTPIATIGVRGTDYELFFCDQNCADSGQEHYGLFGQVLEGIIFLDIAGKKTDIQAGSHFYLDGNVNLRLSQSSYRNRSQSGFLPNIEQQSIPAIGIEQGVDANQRDNFPGANGQYPRSP
ncbi:MAG: FecR family protein [Neptuniibacter sp.]